MRQSYHVASQYRELQCDRSGPAPHRRGNLQPRQPLRYGQGHHLADAVSI